MQAYKFKLTNSMPNGLLMYRSVNLDLISRNGKYIRTSLTFELRQAITHSGATYSYNECSMSIKSTASWYYTHGTVKIQLFAWGTKGVREISYILCTKNIHNCSIQIIISNRT